MLKCLSYDKCIAYKIDFGYACINRTRIINCN